MMLLSKSELFWVGLLSGMLSRQPLDPPDEEGYEPVDYSPPTVYDQLMQLAEACALGDRPVAVACDEPADGIDIDSLVWAKAGHDPVPMDSLEVRDAIATLAEATASLRAQFTEIHHAEHAAKRFEEILSEDNALLYGYTRSSPGVLYGVRTNGEFRVVYRVPAMPQGTLRSVLRILLPHVALPPVVLMSLAAAGDAVPEWHDSWTPSSWSVHRPIGETDRAAALVAIESDLIGGAREEAEYRLGRRLGAVITALESLDPWICYELTKLYHALGNARLTGFQPAHPPVPKADDAQGGEFSPEEDASLNEGAADPFAVGSNSSDAHQEEDEDTGVDWAEAVNQAAIKACTQVGFGVAVPTLASPTKPVLKGLQGDLKQAIAAAKELGLDPAIAGLTVGDSLVSDLLREHEDQERLPPGTLLQGMFDRRESLGNYGDRLRVLLAFIVGELRMGDLLPEGAQRGLAPESLAGWTNLNKNPRDAVREGLHMLSQGKAPFAVINLLQPVLENVVRKLVAIHLTRFRGTDLRNALAALVYHAREQHDADLEAYANIAVALRRLRNSVVHEHDRTYDQHDAVFFAQGLAILLRSIA